MVGITEHSSSQLGDIVFIELPEEGTTVSKDDEIVVIESVKAASDILSPLFEANPSLRNMHLGQMLILLIKPGHQFSLLIF